MADILHKDLVGDDIHELKVVITSQPPNIIPKFVGQGLYDIVNKKFYVAQGTSLITDWVTTPIPPFLIFADTRTIKWTSNQIGNELTYEAEVDEAELILTASNVTDFNAAVLAMPEIIALIADQHTKLILRTGSEAGGWAPLTFNGLELDSDAQKIKLTQNLSTTGNPTFDEITLTIKSKTPLLTLTAGGIPTAASMFLDATKGVILRGDAGSVNSFVLQNETGSDVVKNLVGTNQVELPSLSGINAPYVVHADANGLLSSSKLIDADVDAAAAIAGTKISPDFGTQDITTTGSVLVDTIESNTNDIGILTGNDNKTILIGTGTGYNTINLGGVNTTVNIQGATYTTPIEYVSEDKNIVVNFNASGQDSPDSGLYVQEEYSGALINLTDATWQSGNTVRYIVDIAGIDGLVAGEYVRITGFVNSENNGTFKVLVANSGYIDVVNPKRTDASKDESSVSANAARLLLNGYVHVGSTRMSWEVRAPAHSGIIELKPQSAAKTLQITSESANNVTVKLNTNLTVDQDLQKTSSVEFSGAKISTFGTGIVHSNASGELSSSLIQNIDVDAAAAIAGTKISPDFGTQDISTTGNTVTKSLKVTGNEPITGATIFASATNGVVFRGQAGSASQFKFISDLGASLVTITDVGQITFHNLSTTGIVKSTLGVLSSALLTNADVDAAAAIEGSKIQAASATNTGVVSTTTQTFAGDKTFNGSVAISGLSTAGVVHNNASGVLSTSLVTNADVDPLAAIDASKIANQPSGNIAATTIQAAVNELDTEKVSKAGDSLTGSLDFSTNAGIESSVPASTLNVGTLSNTSTLNVGTGSSVTAINIGTGTGATTINIGNSTDTINITGTLNSVNVTNMEVSDKNITLNKNGAVASGDAAGLEIEENGVIAGYARVGNSRASWEFKAPGTDGSLKLTPSVSMFDAELAIPSITGNTVYTFPAITDTLVGLSTTDNLSNKTIFNPIIDKITPYNLDNTFEIDSTAALKIPSGTNAEKTLFTAADGMIRFNTTTGIFEGYSNSQWASLAGTSTATQINQVAHGLSTGDAVYLDGVNYVKAIATLYDTSKVVGIVSKVADLDNFELTLSGEVTKSGWGLVAGSLYYLSDSTPGQLSLTEPTVVGRISVPVGVAKTSSSLYVDVKSLEIVGDANLRTLISVTNNSTTNVLDITNYNSLKLEGELNVLRSSGGNQRAFYTVQATRIGAGTWQISSSYTGDNILYTTSPVWSISGETLQLTMPNVTNFTSSSLTYSIYAPAIGLTQPDSWQKLTADGYALSAAALNQQTTSYVLQTSDNGRIIIINSSSAVNVTVPSGLPIGFNCAIIQVGTGQVTMVASGVTLNSANGLKTAAQHAAVSIISYTANTYNVSGNTMI